jgi:hypothetical protein
MVPPAPPSLRPQGYAGGAAMAGIPPIPRFTGPGTPAWKIHPG